MLNDSKIFVGSSAEKKRAYILPEMANRHGLIAGATGSGKTITLKVIAESFSSIGVPVFLADVKGDLASIAKAGEKTHKIVERLKLCSVEESEYVNSKCPVAVWDIYGKNGIQLRTTISEMGPLLLSGILDLNELQSGILSIIFKIADDNRLLLIDTKDLKALLAYVSENKKELAQVYGNIYYEIGRASVGKECRSRWSPYH